MMTAKEQWDALKHFDLESAVEDICRWCPKVEDCNGFLSRGCPFSIQIEEVLGHLYDAECAIRNGEKSAEEYYNELPYEYDPFEDVHNQPMYYISAGRYVPNYG